MYYIWITLKNLIAAYFHKEYIIRVIIAFLITFLLICMKNKKLNNKHFLKYAILSAYLTAILAVTLLMRDIGTVDNRNLDVWATYRFYLETGSMYAVWEIVTNMILFFPAGIILERNLGIGKCSIVLLAFSLGIESLQLFFATGAFELCDIINNVSGGLAGYFIAWAIRKYMNKG